LLTNWPHHSSIHHPDHAKIFNPVSGSDDGKLRLNFRKADDRTHRGDAAD
jgi:hypothetical protein